MSYSSDLVSSPCVSNCCLNDEDICLGCFRSLEEIKSWSIADNQQRRQFLALAEQRRRIENKRNIVFPVK